MVNVLSRRGEGGRTTKKKSDRDFFFLFIYNRDRARLEREQRRYPLLFVPRCRRSRREEGERAGDSVGNYSNLSPLSFSWLDLVGANLGSIPGRRRRGFESSRRRPSSGRFTSMELYRDLSIFFSFLPGLGDFSVAAFFQRITTSSARRLLQFAK